MFNDYVRAIDPYEDFHRLWPSHKHFSLFVNRWRIGLIVVGSPILAAIISTMISTLGLLFLGISVIIQILFIIYYFNAYKIDKLHIADIFKVEKRYNAMPKDKRKEYARYLTACYKEPDSDVVRKASELFDLFGESVTTPRLTDQIDEELTSVRSAKMLAEKIYRESMRSKD